MEAESVHVSLILNSLQVLNWKLNHNTVTVNTWVNTYMQLGSYHLRPSGIKVKEFDYPAYSSVEFPKVMKLLDLCTLDIASRKFGSSVLAAAAVYLQCERSRSHMMLTMGEWRDLVVVGINKDIITLCFCRVRVSRH